MPIAATGSQALFGWRREQAYNVPGTEAMVFLRPIPPLTAELVRTDSTSPEINQVGAMQPSIPGGITGASTTSVALTSETILEPLESILGEAQQTEPETDVFQYVITPNRDGADTSFDAMFSKPPVSRDLLYGFKPSTATMTFTPNTMVRADIAGFVSHGTAMEAPQADVGNTGSYADDPRLRGVLKKPRSGESVHIEITRDVAGGGLQYKAERIPSGGAAASIPGAAQDVAYDSSGNGKWQNLLGTYQITGTVSVTISTAAVTGVGTAFTSELEVGQYLTIAGEDIAISAIASDTALTLASNHSAGASAVRGYVKDIDFGIWAENYDPLEVIFPGDSTAHGDADIGDIWTSGETWSDPTATYVDGQRFTGAHLLLEYQNDGETTWNPIDATQVSVAQAWPVTPDPIMGTRYYGALDRDQPHAPAITITRKYRDDVFREKKKQGANFALRLSLLGKQLGTGAYRKSIVGLFPYCSVSTVTQPLSSSTAIIETINVSVEDGGTGDDVCTWTVITDRDWTPIAV